MTFRRQRQDRFIGELSYPIYLVHYAVILALLRVFQALSLSLEHLGQTAAFVSIILAAVFYVLCLKRIDRKRHSLTASSELRGAGPPRREDEASTKPVLLSP
jgi:peptidoglycan/LPS O-acetylase OafA/YrhL